MATTTRYHYKVRDRNGNIVEGVVEAESKTAVRDKLRSMGATPLDIKEAATGLQREIKFGMPKQVKMKDLAVFARQFATMIDSGLAMLRSLQILAEQTENEELRKVLRMVKSDVESGSPLSEAFSKHPKVFPMLMVNMTRAGEVGGFLDKTMLEIAEAYEAEVRLKGKIKSAMTYPVVVFVLAMLMCVAMLIFVVPVFSKMFENLGGELPAPTKVLVFMSQSLKSGLPLLAILGFAGVFTWRKYSTHPAVRNVLDPLKLRLPVFGALFQKIALARFARNFGTLLSAGVPILQCLDIVADTTGSVVIARAVRSVQDSVRQGESIAKPLSAHEVFPPMVVQMMSVGEDTGALDQMLGKIAEFYDQEVEATTEALTALIEPLMIAFLGGIVGSMIVALYMPIFKVFNLISSRGSRTKVTGHEDESRYLRKRVDLDGICLRVRRQRVGLKVTASVATCWTLRSLIRPKEGQKSAPWLPVHRDRCRHRSVESRGPRKCRRASDRQHPPGGAGRRLPLCRGFPRRRALRTVRDGGNLKGLKNPAHPDDVR